LLTNTDHPGKSPAAVGGDQDNVERQCRTAMSNRGCDMSGNLLFQDHASGRALGVFALGLIGGFSIGIVAVLLAA
jgi:hypothetical protein